MGDRFVNCEILLSTLTQPIDNILKYLAREHDIYLKPRNKINKLIIHSENEKAKIKGNLGYTNLRGRAQDSFERQLAEQVNSPITFNSEKTYRQLQNEYSHLIMATGDGRHAEKMQNYRTDLTVTLYGGFIRGNFEEHTVRAWMNNNFAPLGYGYLIPVSTKEANVVIAFPEYREVREKNYEKLWANFKREISLLLGHEVDVFNRFEKHGYYIGLCQQAQVDNILFTGNNFGVIMPFLGFGQAEAMLSGIFAAQALTEDNNYEDLTSSLRKSYQDSLALRQTVEKLNNPGLDRLVKTMSGRIGQKIFTPGGNYLKILGKILKPLV